MEYIQNMKKSNAKIIMSAFVVLILLSVFMFPSSATDLPIDIDAIPDSGIERQDAITAIHGVDLFSETSTAVSAALIAQQERRLLELKESLFTQPYELIIPDQYETLLQAAIDARLFETPFRSRRYVPSEEAEAGIPMWIIIPFLVLSVGLGLFIAIYTRAKRMEKHVHNNND